MMYMMADARLGEKFIATWFLIFDALVQYWGHDDAFWLHDFVVDAEVFGG